MMRDSRVERLWTALGLCALCACSEADLRDAFETDRVSVGERQAGSRETRLDLRGCAEGDCEAASPEPKPVSKDEVRCEPLYQQAFVSWEVNLPPGPAFDGCEGECEASSMPELAVTSDGSLWVLVAMREGVTFGEGLSTGGSSLLLLLQYNADGQRVGIRVVDRDESPEANYDSQLVVLESGGLAMFVHKSVGWEAPMRREGWIAPVEVDGMKVGDRVPVDLTLEEASIRGQFGLRHLLVSPAGGSRVAFGQPSSPQAEPAPGLFGVLDMEQLRVSWLKTQPGVTPALFEVAADSSGELTTLSGPGEQFAEVDTIVRFDADGEPRWARTIDRGAPGTPAVSKGVDGGLIYAAATFYTEPLPGTYQEEIEVLELDRNGKFVRRMRSRLPDRGSETSPGGAFGFAAPVAVTLTDGSIVTPLGDRAINDGPSRTGIFDGSLLYHVSPDRSDCRLLVHPRSGVFALKAAPQNAMYVAHTFGFGRVEVDNYTWQRP